MKRFHKIIILLAISALLLACSTLGFARDASGKLIVETHLSLDFVENMIEGMVDTSQFADLEVELNEGYVFIHAAVVDFNGITFEDVSFHLELFVVDGQLSARITNVNVADSSLQDDLFESVNQMISERLVESQGEMEMMDRATLINVQVSPEGITLVWRLNGDG